MPVQNEAYESRVSRLETESRDAASQVAAHGATLNHLADKIMEVKDDIADLKSDFRSELGTAKVDFRDQLNELKTSIGDQISTLSSHVTQTTDRIASNSTRITRLEEARLRAGALKKWAIGVLGAIVVSGATYEAQQILSHLHHIR